MTVNLYSEIGRELAALWATFDSVVCRGGVGERLKPPVLKTGVHSVDREFESRPLRQPDSEFLPAIS